MAKILITDDEPAILSILTKLFTMRGFEVVTASDGEEALATLTRHPEINLLVMDKRMPKADGLAVVRAMIKDCIHIPVIILTGSLGREFTEEDLGGPAPFPIRYLTKPLEFEAFLGTVEELLGGHA